MRATASLLALLLLVAGAVLPAAARADDEGPSSVDALAAGLDRSDPATARLAGVLDSLAGRAALAEALEDIRVEALAARCQGALERVLAEVAERGPASAWLGRTAREVRKDLVELKPAVEKLASTFHADAVIARDLEHFLLAEDATRLLYEHLLAHRYRPRVAGGRLGRWLAEADDGTLHVPKALREVSAEALDEVDAAVEREVDKPYRSPGRYGEDYEILRSARHAASRLKSTDDPLLVRWRAALTSDRALRLAGKAEARAGRPWQMLMKHTWLGRALYEDAQGRMRLNRHAAAEADVHLLDIRRGEEERATLRGRIETFTTDLEAGALRDALRSTAGRLLLVDMALREAGEAPIDPWSRWRARTFDSREKGLVVREEAHAAVLALVARAEVVAGELKAEGARSLVDPSALPFSTDGLDILRSSVFYNPRTFAGRWRYVTEFDDHYAARLFGTYGWNAKVSKDLADYEQRIRAQKPRLVALARTHEKIVIHISGVPPWLSSHTGSGTFEGGGWDDKQTHPPKDLETWKRMIRVLAETFRAAPCERYYEFWNEPDLKYWQGSLADFLSLYETTVRVIREVDPEGRVGGVATNQWDGRIHKKTGSDVLNFELIRFAAKHDVPLDFISWHHFGRPVAHIQEAKDAYLAEWQRAGFEGEPEWLVTEWSMPARGTPHAGPLVGEALLAFWEAGVDLQTTACWEEFHAKPDPKGFGPWGLITQQGLRHGTYFVQRFVDRWVRGSEGAAVLRTDSHRTVAVSKKAGGVLEVLVWQRGSSPRLKAAWQVLEEAGFASTDGRVYGVLDRLERALVEGEPVASRWQEAFGRARSVHADHPVQTERLVLAVSGAEVLEVLYAESVRTAHRVVRPAVLEGVLTLPLDRDEVVRLVLRVR